MAILAEMGLEEDSFAGSVKDYRLPGAYRRLIAKPTQFSVECVPYGKENENILQSERDWLPELGNGIITL